MENYKVVLTGLKGFKTTIVCDKSKEEAQEYLNDFVADDLQEVKDNRMNGDKITHSHLKNGEQISKRNWKGELVYKQRYTIEK